MSNFVLVHGGFQGSWIWQPTVKCLRDAGHTVYAPTLAGCAERLHEIRPGITVSVQAREVADMMFFEDIEDAILVGTSFGGMVISKAAELVRERVHHLVYVDALAPQPGETCADIVNRDPNTDYQRFELTQGPTKRDMETRLFADFEPGLKDWAVARYTLHPNDATDALPGELDVFWAQNWAATVIRCAKSANPSEAHQRRTAEKLNGVWHEMNAGHYPMLTHPEELTQLLTTI
ncbi:MAG: alpha/beta hydrolase [Alphaproteobacteria bacterium]|nr:alpha/beta hydrolase [Alphaproteobacteria bacterium]